MRDFAKLFTELDTTPSTTAKVEAMRCYFAAARAQDAAWAVYFLSGGKLKQVIKTASLRALACQGAGIEDWLFDECYQAVGDLAETIAYVLPLNFAPSDPDPDSNSNSNSDSDSNSDVGLAVWVEQRLLPLRGLGDDSLSQRITNFWRELDPRGRFLLIKLVGGGFRVGVSQLLVQRALAAHCGVDAKRIAQRMMGYVDAKNYPNATKFIALTAHTDCRSADIVDVGQPYPFFLAHPLDADVAVFDTRLGLVDDWLVEWKYDGIRGQIVKRSGQVWIWSRGEELVTQRFPEIVALAQQLPDGTVLDGEILVWRAHSPGAPSSAGSSAAGDAASHTDAGSPAPFAVLQQRLGRKTLSKKLLTDAPVIFMAYDVLERGGRDLRGAAQHARRTALEQLLHASAIKLSALERLPCWADFAALRRQSRARGVEGFMLKQRNSAYGTGRTKADGLWWKWKIEPMTIDCVLIYAQAGHGRRASLYTDYTLAVWNRQPADAAQASAVVQAIAQRQPAQPDGLQLVAFAKAYSGLTDEEFKQIDAVVRKTTLEKFGPVRSVKPTLVFELGFEGINRSSRHKSGVAVRFPRIVRIRADKPLHEANTLGDLELLLNT